MSQVFEMEIERGIDSSWNPAFAGLSPDCRIGPSPDHRRKRRCNVSV